MRQLQSEDLLVRSNHVIHLLYTLLNGCGAAHAVQCFKRWWLYTPPPTHKPSYILLYVLSSVVFQHKSSKSLHFTSSPSRVVTTNEALEKSKANLCQLLTYWQKADYHNWWRLLAMSVTTLSRSKKNPHQQNRY